MKTYKLRPLDVVKEVRSKFEGATLAQRAWHSLPMFVKKKEDVGPLSDSEFYCYYEPVIDEREPDKPEVRRLKEALALAITEMGLDLCNQGGNCCPRGRILELVGAPRSDLHSVTSFLRESR